MKLGIKILAIILIYFAVSFVLFLGLQVNPAYGTGGMIILFALFLGYLFYKEKTK